jgi:hypothetical protein
VLTNPRESFKVSNPQSFVKFHIEDNKSEWYFFPVAFPVKFPPGDAGDKTYGYTTDTQSQAMPFGGVLCSLVSANSVLVGTDVVGKNLYQIIFGPPGGNTNKLEQYLVNRSNQMISKVDVVMTAKEVRNALSDPLTIAALVAGERDFYLFSPDGQSLKVLSKTMTVTYPWLAMMINKKADGDEQKFVNDASMPGLGFHIPQVTPEPFCVLKTALGWQTWHKDLWFRPGTGYNGCLGEVRSQRRTKVYSLGVCTPII